jgi:hypothetical protein
MSYYTVTQGDCLSSIAAQNGFADYRVIYDHPNNADFKARRPNPNIIYPGDVVFIPDKKRKTVSVPTGDVHVFQIKTSKTRFRVRIQFGVPFTYHLDIEGAPFDGALDDGAIIDVAIPPDARKGKLSIWPNSNMDSDPLEFEVALGALDPIDEASGVQARLNNLGFDCGAVDGDVGPKTEHALRAFQGVAQLEITGQIDDPTRDAIRARHDIG